jgi:hypothetical protein
MNYFTGTIRNSAGQAQPGISVTVFLSDGITFATGLLKRDGTALGNPFNSDDEGIVTFGGNGSFIVKATIDGEDLSVPVQLVDRSNLLISTGSAFTLNDSTSSARQVLQNTLNAVPTITSITASAPVGGTVTIHGTGLAGANGVQFGAGFRFHPPMADTVNFVSDTTITAVVPDGAENGHITVKHPLGDAVSSASFVVASAPTIDRMSPESPEIIGVGLKASVFGIRFTGLTGITCGATHTPVVSYSLKSDRILEFTVPDGATTGQVIITTPYGSVNAGILTIQPAPTITAVPGSPVALGDVFPVTGNFDPPPWMVSVGGVPAHWTLADPTQINVTAPNVIGGSGFVKVASASGTAISASAVTISGTDTEASDLYVGDERVNEDNTAGSDINCLLPDFPTHVYFNDVELTRDDGLNPDLGPVRYDLHGVSSPPIHGVHVVLPVGPDDQTFVGAVTFECPSGNGTVSYRMAPSAPPVITGFTPASGPRGSRVRLHGTGFLSAGYVKCAGIGCSFQIIDDNNIDVDIHPNCATGPFSVFNLNFQGNGSSDSFEVTDTVINITAMSHNSGPVGTEVQFTCTDLRGLSDDIAFQDADLNWIDVQQHYWLQSQTLLNSWIPPGAAQGVGHFFINGVQSPPFTVTAPQAPTLTAPTGTKRIGDVIPLEGEHFNNVTEVKINATVITPRTFWSRIDSRRIALVIPPGTASNATIYITAAGGQCSVVSTLTISGTRPAPTVRVDGNTWVDANGDPTQLRGVVASSLEDYAVQGYHPWLSEDNPPYGYEPEYARLRFWGVNFVRFPINEASWLGYWCHSGDGTPINPDPFSDYRATLRTSVHSALDAGLGALIDMHWTAPSNALPYLQQAMANQENTLRAWSSVATEFGSLPGVFFEPYNEPFKDTDAFPYTVDWWNAWKRGGMSVGRYQVVVSRDTGQIQDQWTPWTTAGMQQMIDAIRATGSESVCILGGWDYSGDASGMLHNMPVDALNQIAVNVHFYSPIDGAGLPSLPSNYPVLEALHTAGYAIMCSESGDVNAPGTIGSAWGERFYADFDTKGWSYGAWAYEPRIRWNQWSNLLINTFDGVPAPGWGSWYLRMLQEKEGITYTGA